MSTFRPEQLRQPLSLSGSFTGSLQGTASYAVTASYALNGGGGGTGTVGPGAQNYLAFFSGSTTSISSSVIYQSGSNSIGIFTNQPTYSVDIQLEGKGDNGFRIRTGTSLNSTVISTYQNTIYLPTVPSSSVAGESAAFQMLVVDTQNTNQIYRTGYTGGGGTGAGFPFSGSAVITGSLLVSGSTPVALLGLPTASLTDKVHPIRINESTGQLGYENFVQYTILFTDESNYTVLINTIGKTPTVSKIGTGEYSIKYSTSTLTADKTAVILSPGTTSDGFVRYRIQDVTELKIFSYDFSGFDGAPTLADNFNKALLDIKVYS